MKEVTNEVGAILFKSTPEEDPIEKRILILEKKVEELTILLKTIIENIDKNK